MHRYHTNTDNINDENEDDVKYGTQCNTDEEDSEFAEDDSSEYGSSHSDESFERISQHPIVFKWVEKLKNMSDDLLSIYGDNESVLMAAMGITNVEYIKDWDDALHMTSSHHCKFTQSLTTQLSVDVKQYVEHRLIHIIEFLKCITGSIGDYVRETYIEPFINDILDRWQWESLFQKWSCQFEYMENDLQKCFGTKQQLMDAMQIETKTFDNLIQLEDIEMNENVHCLEMSTDRDLVIASIKRTIQKVGHHLEILQNANLGSEDIVDNYRRCFKAAIEDDSEWDRLIDVKPPLTNVI